MTRILFSWIGKSDLMAAGLGRKGSGDEGRRDVESDLGPIARTLCKGQLSFDRVVLLDDDGSGADYCNWLRAQMASGAGTSPPPELAVVRVDLEDKPMDYARVYHQAGEVLDRFASPNCEHFMLISAGTLAMQLGWYLLAATDRYRSRLLQSSKKRGVELIPEWLELVHRVRTDEALAEGRQIANHLLDTALDDEAFSQLVVDPSGVMQKPLAMAVTVAGLNFSVHIWGESGSGKESIARLIHNQSGRKGKPFKDINCAAIPKDLLESELFGVNKGAFTGASGDRTGLIEAAGDGTVFLDEIADLAFETQAKLLRLLQEKTFRRVGDTTDRNANCRFISASHANLLERVKVGRFREDLYFRLCQVTIRVPPLRERGLEEFKALTRRILQTIREANPQLGELALADAVWPRLHRHGWPGNIRELENVLKMAAVSALMFDRRELGVAEIDAAITPPESAGSDLLNRPLAGLKLKELNKELIKHYYQRIEAEWPGEKRPNFCEIVKVLGLSEPTVRSAVGLAGARTARKSKRP